MTIQRVNTASELALTTEPQVLFHRSSSSYEDTPDDAARLRCPSLSYNQSSVHLIDEPGKQSLQIIIKV